ncbi:MAG: hypothetical protein Q9226_002845 [Calogaya cf. arnoldii]
MHASISLFLAAASLPVANILAAPAGLSPSARDISPSQSISTSATPTTSDINQATVTPTPAQRRQARGSINMLEDFVLPQSKSSSSSSASSTSSFVFRITRPTPPAAARPARVQKRQARGDINMLEDIVLPQSISSATPSVSSSSSFVFRITRPTPPAAAPVKLAERDDHLKAAKNEDNSFGLLADLSFPQMISSSSATPSPTPAAVLSPSRHPLAPSIEAPPAGYP